MLCLPDCAAFLEKWCALWLSGDGDSLGYGKGCVSQKEAISTSDLGIHHLNMVEQSRRFCSNV